MTLEDIWNNPMLWTDCYNLSHSYLKKDFSFDVSHIYNRKQGQILYGFNETVRKVLNQRIYEDQVEEADRLARKMGLRFPVELFMRVAKDFKGRIPLKVEALPDGTWCPTGTPFAQIMSTEDECGELVTYWEGMFLHAAFPSGVATRTMWMKRYLLEHKLPTHRFHSFGFRGHNSMENAYWASTAWNLFMSGTDDLHSIQHTPKAKISSIAASAHKVEQQFDNELEGYYFAVKAVSDKGDKIVAMPIDTYDPQRFIFQYSHRIADYANRLGVHVVFRPDSGDVIRQAISIYNLMTSLGHNNTSVIIGEGITFEKIKEYDQILLLENVPLAYVSYGIGAGLYKDIDRDWTGWAMKTAYSNHAPRMKFSTPLKQSIPGQVNLIRNEKNELVVEYTSKGLYEPIYDYNQRSTRPEVKVQTWEEIQQIALKQDVSQERIILSQSVLDKIEELRKQYLN